LEEVGHPHPPTPMETDNTTATGYSNGTIKQKRSKVMDMRFYWINGRFKQGQFNVYWGPGYQSLADYLTKHHSPAHHKRMVGKIIKFTTERGMVASAVSNDVNEKPSTIKHRVPLVMRVPLHVVSSLMMFI
jgi:hypothetical protein